MKFLELATIVQKELEELCGFDFTGYTITYKLNKRFKTTLGRCTRNSVKQTATIEIAEKLFTEGHLTQVRETIAHELTHVMQVGGGHGESFRHFASVVTANTVYNVTRTGYNPVAVHKANKYSITCNDCGVVSYRKVASKVVKQSSRYHCAVCGGKLTVKEL